MNLIKTLQFLGALGGEEDPKPEEFGKTELESLAGKINNLPGENEPIVEKVKRVQEQTAKAYNDPEAYNRFVKLGWNKSDPKKFKDELAKNVERMSKIDPEYFDDKTNLRGEYKGDKIRINKDEKNVMANKPHMTAAHEFTHGISGDADSASVLPLDYNEGGKIQLDVNEYIDEEKKNEMLKDKRFGKTEKERQTYINYFGNEEEVRSNLNVLRAARKEATGKEWWDAWTEEDLDNERLMELGQGSLNTFRLLFKDKNIIEMLNKFALNEKSKIYSKINLA